MNNEQKPVCLALLQYIDRRYSSGFKLKSFCNKKDFEDFLERYHGMLYSDQALIIFHGGDHQIKNMDSLKTMQWILDEP